MKSFLGYQDDEPDPVIGAPKHTPINLVRSELKSRPGAYLTTANLCAITGLTPVQVNGAIYVLTRQNHIARLITDQRITRNSGQAYQWREGKRSL